jgi:hypothetical protein
MVLETGAEGILTNAYIRPSMTLVRLAQITQSVRTNSALGCVIFLYFTGIGMFIIIIIIIINIAAVME